MFRLYVLCLLAFLNVQANLLNPKDPKCLEEVENNGMLFKDKNTIVLENTPESNRYLQCVWKKKGFIDENGTVNYYKLQRALEQDLANKYNNYIRTYIAEKTISQYRNECVTYEKSTCVDAYNALTTALEETIKKMEEEEKNEN